MDVLTPEQRSKNMKHIRSSDTKAEIMLRKALWHHGIRYRKNYDKLPGKPDVVLTRYHIAIFVDGDFWHARGHQKNPGEQIKSHQDFWKEKLCSNVSRDKEVNDLLTEQGWIVLRFWEYDVKYHLNNCLEQIYLYLPQTKDALTKK